MDFSEYPFDDVVVLKCVGEVDSFNLSAFSKRLEKLKEQGELLILDLVSLDFVNSAALGYLVHTSKTLTDRGGELVLARPSKFIRKALKTLDLEELFTICDTVESAITHLKPGTGPIHQDGEASDPAPDTNRS